MSDTLAIMQSPTTTALTPSDVVNQVALIQQIMSAVMRKGEHYDTIPGCGDKPTLLQPGAQKLALTFNLAAEYEIDMRYMDNSHREYEVTCKLVSRNSGLLFGEGVGTCTTMESKYRYRGTELIDLEMDVPAEYWDIPKDKRKSEKAYALLGGKDRVVQKVDGIWGVFKKGEKSENPDIADTYNTVLKMAKKRAYVDAVLTSTAASDLFTQDLEDLNRYTPKKHDYMAEFKEAFGAYVKSHKDDGITGEIFKNQVEQVLGFEIKTATDEDLMRGIEYINELTAKENNQEFIVYSDIEF